MTDPTEDNVLRYTRYGNNMTQKIGKRIKSSERPEYDKLSVGAVSFDVYDPVTGRMNELLVDWTQALAYLRLHHGGHVQRIYWMKGGDRNTIGRHGWTWAKWTGIPNDNMPGGYRYEIHPISGGDGLWEIEVEVKEP